MATTATARAGWLITPPLTDCAEIWSEEPVEGELGALEAEDLALADEEAEAREEEEELLADDDTDDEAPAAEAEEDTDTDTEGWEDEPSPVIGPL